jgi:hypothetical protein
VTVIAGFNHPPIRNSRAIARQIYYGGQRGVASGPLAPGSGSAFFGRVGCHFLSGTTGTKPTRSGQKFDEYPAQCLVLYNVVNLSLFVPGNGAKGDT